MKRAVLLLAMAWPMPAALAARPGPVDPDWPCQQIKVPEISLASAWQGPPVEPFAATWSQDPVLQDLVRRTAQRRMTIADATAEIDAYAQRPGANLLALLAGLYETLNREREAVVSGLDRFGRRQRELAGDLRADADKLHAGQASQTGQAGQAAEDTTAMVERLTWETRLFEQRRQSISYACAVPDVIEQRLFALAHAIQKRLGP